MDPVTLQVMVGALRAACDEMGAVLIRSAHSANIKERRDASTALFDADGQMVMQAEHIPVHLGAMPAAVAAVLDEDHAPGDAWILNDPYRGGTHLPDITVISPVFAGGELLGFAASRAHHADVGGRDPGLHAGRLDDARGRGRRDPAQPLARAGELDASCSTGRADAPPATSARPTCAPSSPPTAPAARRAARSSPSARARRAARGDGRDRSTTRSGAPARASPS